jgi:hypothetical protein
MLVVGIGLSSAKEGVIWTLLFQIGNEVPEGGGLVHIAD